MEFKFELGEDVKDIVTDFKGIIMGRSEYFTGCIHYGLVSRKLQDGGKPLEYQWFDETRLERTGKKGIKIDKTKRQSGIMPPPPSM